MGNRRNIAIAAVLIIIVGLFLYNRQRLQKTKKIETATVKRGTLKETLTLSGSIDAEERVVLRFQTGGRLAWVGVKKGDPVKKYQVIATLDQQSVKKNLQKELNDFAKTRLDLDQNRDDNKDNVITDAIKRTLEKYQYDVNNTVLDVELQDLALQYSRLSTPIDGVVTAISTPYAGVNVTAANAEFEIINPSSIYFTINADQTEVTQVKEGMIGELILDSYPDDPINGSIHQIGLTPVSGETGIVYTVKFLFDKKNAADTYRLGMTGDVNFVTKSKQNALYLPVKYIKEENDKKYVYAMVNGKKVKKPVITGIETEIEIEITSGLSEGETVYDQT